MDKAFALVDLAVDAGADVLKIQHFKTDLLVGATASEWRDRLRSKELSDSQVISIKQYCDQRNIVFMCTGHDEESLAFLNRTVAVPGFKIGSGEIKNWNSIKSIAGHGKPIILSTGMYELEDIRDVIKAVSDGGGTELAILHCITSYPTDAEDVNLSVMSQIREFFEGPVGYSDHTSGTAVPLAAVAMGADIIEKHITLDFDVPDAQDWKVACGPQNFAAFVSDVREIESAIGGKPKTVSLMEKDAALWARKSIVARVDIPSGVVISSEMLIYQRPGTGMCPSERDDLIGQVSKIFIPEGTVLSAEMVSSEILL